MRVVVMGVDAHAHINYKTVIEDFSATVIFWFEPFVIGEKENC